MPDKGLLVAWTGQESLPSNGVVGRKSGRSASDGTIRQRNQLIGTMRSVFNFPRGTRIAHRSGAGIMEGRHTGLRDIDRCSIPVWRYQQQNVGRQIIAAEQFLLN